MPKVHTTVYDYKNKINDLESEVSTLKRRLDELRRAKVQAFYKQPVAVRRSSKPEIQAVEQVNQTSVSVLEQKITRLTNELELEQLRYLRDTKELKETIKRLQSEMSSVRENHQDEINKLNDKHHYDFELLKREHTEELALFTEKVEIEKSAKLLAEKELLEYKSRMKSFTIQMPDVDVLKSELSRLQEAYHSLKVEHEVEVNKLEERITELLADIASHHEKSKRKFQLIPDRTYIVKKSTPTASSSSIGSGAERNSSSEISCNKSSVTRYKATIKKEDNSKISENTVEMSNNQQVPDPDPSPKCQVYNNRVETIDRPKSITTIRPKSSFTRKQPSLADKPTQVRPKSCWSEKRSTGTEKRVTSNSNRARYGNVSSRIDTGLADHVLPREPLVKRPGARSTVVGSGGPSWQNSRGNRSYVARSNYF